LPNSLIPESLWKKKPEAGGLYFVDK